MRLKIWISILCSVVAIPAYAVLSVSCLTEGLKELGWNVKSTGATSSGKISIEGGTPCEAGTVPKISVPANASPLDLYKLFYTEHSLCLYRGRLLVAATDSVKAFGENKGAEFGYRYSILMRSACVVGGERWEKESFLDPLCIVAKGDAAAAVKCFRNEKCKMDCMAGQQAFAMDLHRQAFGDERFSRAFADEKLLIGTGRASSINKAFDSRFGFYVDDARHSPSSGPLSMVGSAAAIVGILENEDQKISSKADQNENFVITSMTESAIKDFYYKGEKYESNIKRLNHIAREFWKTKDETLLNRPFFTQTYAWVFPLGNLSLKQHLVRLLDVNKEIPYEFRIYNDETATYFYPKYASTLVEEFCSDKPLTPKKP